MGGRLALHSIRWFFRGQALNFFEVIGCFAELLLPDHARGSDHRGWEAYLGRRWRVVPVVDDQSFSQAWAPAGVIQVEAQEVDVVHEEHDERCQEADIIACLVALPEFDEAAFEGGEDRRGLADYRVPVEQREVGDGGHHR